MKQIRYIALHHSETLWGSLEYFDNVAKDKMVSQDLVSKKYTGFHYIINNGFHTLEDFKANVYKPEFDGLIEEGRSQQTDGIHLNGFNHNSIAILIVGDFNKTSPTARQISSLLSLLTEKCYQYNLLVAKVIGHREGEVIINNFFSDPCPGKKFDTFSLRKELSKTIKF